MSVRFRKSSDKFEGSQLRVELDITRVLDRRVARGHVQAVSGLENLSILRSPLGTNFPVTGSEVGHLVRLCREASSVGPPPVAEHESWPDFASSDAGFVRTALEASSGNRRDLFLFLAEHHDERMTYREVCEGLGWERKTLPPVLSSYLSWSKAHAQRRPYHIAHPNESKSGEWEMWMDEKAAAVVKDAMRP